MSSNLHGQNLEFIFLDIMDTAIQSKKPFPKQTNK
jgi:hypothetical protein